MKAQKSPGTSKAKAVPATKRGNLKKAEIQPLVMAARKAWEVQTRAHLTDETFDAWRRRECMEAVGKPGITACVHADFRPLIAHFQTLAGDDAAALANLLKSGKPTDHAAPGDTREAREAIVSVIAEALDAHTHLATASIKTLLRGAMAFNAYFNPDLPWKISPARAAFKKVLSRRAAIEAKGKGPLTVGYIVSLVRSKTRRPDLTLGKDWKVGLAERCTVQQLTQLRDTVINRIAAIEGVGRSVDRNKSQRSPKARAARSPESLSPRS